MLFLFNSAARSEYVRNVMNTLNFPSGAVNEYQYSETKGNYNYVDGSANPKIQKKLIGEEVLILYMDRDQVPFKYFPLRKGTLVDVEPREGRIYYYVKLGDYAFSESIDQFNDQLNSCFGGYLYRETIDENGNVIQNGFFAFLQDETKSLCLTNTINTGTDKWLETIEQIENCKKFKEENNCVFTKFSIKSGIRTITPRSKNKDWYYRLSPQKEYTAVIDYHFVDATMFEGPSACDVICSLDADKETLQVGNKEGVLGTAHSHFDFTLIANKLGKNSTSQHFHLKSSTEPIRFAQKPMFFKTGISAGRIVSVVFLLLVLFVCNVISGLKTETIIPRYEELKSIGSLSKYQGAILCLAKFANQYCEVVPTITAAVTAGCTALVAFLLGKKE